jgi:16S rRNA processing protein RimM
VKYRIGKIVSVHGLKGFVIVKPTTDNAHNRFTPKREVFLSNDLKVDEKTSSYDTAIIEKATIEKNRVLCKFASVYNQSMHNESVDNVDAARGLIGKSIFIHEDENENSSDNNNEWHINSLLGFSVFDKNGEKLGVIDDIDIYSPQHKLIVSGHIIPFVKELVPIIDNDNKKIIVDLPSGLLEL